MSGKSLTEYTGGKVSVVRWLSNVDPAFARHVPVRQTSLPLLATAFYDSQVFELTRSRVLDSCNVVAVV